MIEILGFPYVVEIVTLHVPWGTASERCMRCKRMEVEPCAPTHLARTELHAQLHVRGICFSYHAIDPYMKGIAAL